jgi:nucleotide-binding universal stress UspA family protein
MFQRSLICTNFHDGLHRLIYFVPDLAAGGLKKIVFLHSIPVWEQEKFVGIDEQEIEAAKNRLSAALEQVPPGIEVKLEVLSGRPSVTIPRIIEAEKIDVVLLGTPIRSSLEKTLFGNMSMELAHSTTTPLMMLRPQLISTYSQEELALRCQHLWRYLLIPYNDSEAARYLIERIKVVAENRSDSCLQKCMLLWVIDEKGRDEVIHAHRLQQAQEKLQSIKTDLEQLDIEVKVEVKEGDPLQEITDVAINYDITAIAISTDFHGNILEWTKRSIVREALDRIWFPLLLFSPKK